MQTIISKDNAKLKAVRALIRSKKDREKSGRFVIEGVRALSAMSGGSALPQYSLKEVWVADDVLDLATEFDVSVFSIPRDFMEQLSDCRTSQGILGVVNYTPAPMEINPEQGRYLLLDRLKDPGNMGTLIRSAVAFGFDGVLLHGDCVEVFNPKTVRASMGALPFCTFQALEADCMDKTILVQTLENLGYELVTTVLRGGENLYEMKFGPKVVLVIGNEANGVSDEILSKANRRLSIPMSGNVESLNAAVAGSICMSAVGRASGV